MPVKPGIAKDLMRLMTLAGRLLQNLGRRFGTSKMHLSPPVAWAAVRSKAVVLLLLTFCLYCYSHCGGL